MNPIADNLDRIRFRIGAAAGRAGISADQVCLVAVSKFQSANVIDTAFHSGQVDFGENYPQELWAKAAVFSDRQIRWHLVGHLQTNKVERTVPIGHLIHSVDSVKLLEALNVCGVKLGRTIPVLLQVNVSKEASKQGFSPAQLMIQPDHIAALQAINVQGLMTIGEIGQPPERNRFHFGQLRELRDRLRREWGSQFALPHLSMGMSNDFELAIEEGATIVRIGTEIFGVRSRPEVHSTAAGIQQ